MILYNKTKYDKLKYKFNLSEKIETSYSQVYQDMFVLAMLNGKIDGTYLEVGGYHPTFLNNTYLLETMYNWRGVSLDIDNVNFGIRKNKCLQADALTIDYLKLFNDYNFNKQIDYLSLDIEPKLNTLECLKRLPLDTYRFSVVTFETDYYDVDGNEEYVRSESRKILSDYGYEMIVGNISNICDKRGFVPFEDWYVDSTNSEITENIKNIFRENSEFNNTGEKLMLDI